MRDLPRDAQLVVKLRQPLVVGRDAVRQELQRDRLIECEVLGAVHLAHAAAAEQGDETVAAGDDRAWGEGRGRSWRRESGGACQAVFGRVVHREHSTRAL